MRNRAERRTIRRSSPDAPQGIVPVAVVGVGLVVLAVVLGAGLTRPSQSTNKVKVSASVHGGKRALSNTATTPPSTALLYGVTTTPLFTTTTTPITTTSSTTTLADSQTLTVSKPTLALSPATPSGTFRVRSTSENGVGFFVTAVPAGMTVTPRHGTASTSQSVTITVTLANPTTARSGTISIVGGDGSQLSVGIAVAGSGIYVTNVQHVPDVPSCQQPLTITATMSQSGASMVTLTVDQSSGQSYAMTAVGGLYWSTVVTTPASGSSISGSITVVDSNGNTTTTSFRIGLASDGSCG